MRPRGPLGDGSLVAGPDDAEVEAPVRRASSELDLDARIEAVREAQRTVYAKDPAFLPLASPYSYTAYRSRVRNVPAGIGTTAAFVNTWWLDGD